MGIIMGIIALTVMRSGTQPIIGATSALKKSLATTVGLTSTFSTMITN
jgi:hypothetical protein